MVEIYCDESHDEHVYALAGWAVTETGRRYFDREWTAMLGRFTMPDGSPMKAFHAAEIVNRDEWSDSRFRGWTFDQEKAAFIAATEVIADKTKGAALLWRVGCAVAIPRDADWVETRDTVWHLVFTRLIIGLVMRYRAQNGFSMTLDNKPEIQRNASHFYDLARGVFNKHAPGKWTEDNLRFVADEDCPLVQAADFWSYEWRRRISEQISKPDKRVRTSYLRLKEGRPDAPALFCYNPVAIAAIRARVTPDTSFVQLMNDYPKTEE